MVPMRHAFFTILLLGCIHPGLPGPPHRGALPPPDDALAASAKRVEETIQVLAGEIGPRSFASQPESLAKAADFIEATWRRQGFAVERQPVLQGNGWTAENLWIRIPGHGPPLVVGAHYDTYATTPGADDNASGVAALLELTRAFQPPVPHEGREILFVAWTTEEPPFFTSRAQGSLVHAFSVEEVYGAISIETIGLYSDEKHTQPFPFPFNLFYPSRGNFLFLVGNPQSRRFVKTVARTFREAELFPTRGATAPAWITGIDWSDHRSYWEIGAPALMVTDTAFLRNPHYHEPTDQPDTVDPMAIARIERGLLAVVESLREAHPNPEVVTLPPAHLIGVEPNFLDALRGGRLRLHGEGLSKQMSVRLGGHRVPIVGAMGSHTLVVEVEEHWAGTFDIEVQGPNGSATLESAVTLIHGPPPTNQGCSNTVLFDHDSAQVTSESAILLEKARFCYTVFPGTIEILGFTDPIGNTGYNTDLGLQRARAVAAVMESLGIDSARLKIRSRGEVET